MTSVQEVLVLIERGCGAAWSHGEAAVLGPGGELRAPCCSLGEDLAVRLLNGTDTMHRAPSCFSTWDGEPLAPCRHLPPHPGHTCLSGAQEPDKLLALPSARAGVALCWGKSLAPGTHG